MRTEPARLALLLPIIAAALLALAACSGDDGDAGGDRTPSASATGAPSGEVTPAPSQPPTPVRTPTAEEAEYFAALQSALAGIHEQAASLAAFRQQAFVPAVTEQTRLDNSVEFARRYQAYGTDAEAALRAITAPASLQAAHIALGIAARAIAAVASDLLVQLEQAPVSTAEALADLYSRANAITMDQRLRDSCYDLQALADSLGAGVDLRCDR